MFIDVTRYGGERRQRLSIHAIAYLDEYNGGCAIRLIGGESFRVSEDSATIEGRVDAALGFANVMDITISSPPVTPALATASKGQSGAKKK
ncbi:MAG TPA: hypothetical protein VF409_07625 [Sphingomonas sp.]